MKKYTIEIFSKNLDYNDLQNSIEIKGDVFNVFEEQCVRFSINPCCLYAFEIFMKDGKIIFEEYHFPSLDKRSDTWRFVNEDHVGIIGPFKTYIKNDFYCVPYSEFIKAFGNEVKDVKIYYVSAFSELQDGSIFRDQEWNKMVKSAGKDFNNKPFNCLCIESNSVKTNACSVGEQKIYNAISYVFVESKLNNFRGE